jgi:hypothetical protein
MATFAELYKTKAVLIKDDGVKIEVPLLKLSQANQDWIKQEMEIMSK